MVSYRYSDKRRHLYNAHIAAQTNSFQKLRPVIKPNTLSAAVLHKLNSRRVGVEIKRKVVGAAATEASIVTFPPDRNPVRSTPPRHQACYGANSPSLPPICSLPPAPARHRHADYRPQTKTHHPPEWHAQDAFLPGDVCALFTDLARRHPPPARHSATTCNTAKAMQRDLKLTSPRLESRPHLRLIPAQCLAPRGRDTGDNRTQSGSRRGGG